MWEGGLIEDRGRSGAVEFGLDDAPEVHISEYTGRQKELLRGVPGLKEVADLVKAAYLRYGIREWHFSMKDAGASVKRHNWPVEAQIVLGLPDPGETFAPSMLHEVSVVVLNHRGRQEFPKELVCPDFQTMKSAVEALNPGGWDAHAIASFIPGFLLQELKDCEHRVKLELVESTESGAIREAAKEWLLNERRKMFHKALGRFSDLPPEILHQFVDEMVVKEVLET